MQIRRHLLQCLAFIAMNAFAAATFAAMFPLPPKGVDIIGEAQVITVPKATNITELGQQYSVGYLEFLEANPHTDIKDGLWAGQKLVVPTRFILPPVPRRGIVINLAELRLYYYPKHAKVVYTFPIGIGRVHTPTPLVKTKIIEKRKNPIWFPTEDTHKEAREMGIMLPEKILPGPQNPLGKYAIRLGLNTYLIHGTNRPDGVGIRSSGGCIRMYPDDVEQLYKLISVGTPVNIIDEPIKIGWKNNVLYVEAHVPVDFKHSKAKDRLQPLIEALKDTIEEQHAKIDWRRATHTADQQNGIPTPVGKRFP
ncbi:MAG: L,D-transpeptidase family protein [Gammaproteobacteria bacterium]|jgi:L,D-transpeptidase ErfK/SrfK